MTRFAARLARAAGHPITVTERSANFHLLFMGVDDDAPVRARPRSSIPNIGDETLSIFNDLPRSTHCLVAAFSEERAPQGYTRAVASIRAVHPDPIRRSCIREELAQGLGLANDSPAARPSIFNDDDEFALPTTHDESLLQMLYDPRLSTGMTVGDARSAVRIVAHDPMGQEFRWQADPE